MYALDAESGLERWRVQTGGAIEASPAVDANGVVHITSDDGYLYSIGLTAGYAASLVHAAEVSLTRNDSAAAEAQFVQLCNLSSSLGAAAGGHTDGSAVGISSAASTLVRRSCQLLNNTRASKAHYGPAWGGYVTPFQYSWYKDKIGPSGALMTLLTGYEANEQAFLKQECTLEQRQALATQALQGIQADTTNMGARYNRSLQNLNAWGIAIKTIDTKMVDTYNLVQVAFQKSVSDTQAKLADLNQQLHDAIHECKSSNIFKVIVNGIIAIAKTVVAVIGLAACALHCRHRRGV